MFRIQGVYEITAISGHYPIEMAMLCSFVQLNKAIPLLLKIQENTAVIPQISENIKAVRKNTDTVPQVLEEVKGMREDSSQDMG